MLTDEMFGVEKKSLTDQLFADGSKDLTDQLFPEAETPPADTVEDVRRGLKTPGWSLETEPVRETIPGKMTSEFIHPSLEEYDRLKMNPILTEQFKNEFVETLRGYKSLAMQPMEVLRGGASFIMSLPGFALGILGAGQKTFERMGTSFTFDDLYDAASEGMAEVQEFWDRKMVEPLLGKPSPESQLVGQTAMAPALGLSMIGHEIASRFEGYPNVQGLLKFAGDIGGLIALGRIYRGSKSEITSKAEEVSQRAQDIAQKEQLLSKTLDEATKKAQEKILEIEKAQLEREAAEELNKLDYSKWIKEDLSSKSERIKQIKQPKREILDEQIHESLEKIGEPSTAEFIGYQRTMKEPVALFNVKGGRLDGSTVSVETLKKEGIEVPKFRKPTAEEVKPQMVEEPTTDLDLQTGTREPVELSTENSPFRETPETTAQRTKLFDEVVKNAEKDPELFTGKLINDVNRWLDGEDVPIREVRNGLSEFASRAEEVKDYFRESPEYPSNFENWKEMVSEAASWARKARREEGGVQLNMMIPVDMIPRMVLDFLDTIDRLPLRAKEKYAPIMGRFIRLGDLFRNKELFDKTGFWLGKDLKWRYEISDTAARYHPPQAVRTLNMGGKTAQRDITEVLDYPELYKAVPEIKDVQVIFDPEHGSLGSVSESYGKRFIFIRNYGDRGTFIHELQHAVNEITGAFRGSSPEEQVSFLQLKAKTELAKILNKVGRPDVGAMLIKDKAPISRYQDYLYKILKDHPKELEEAREAYMIPGKAFTAYREVPGEMEARLVEQRMRMSTEERKRIPPWESLDEMLYDEGYGIKVYDVEERPYEYSISGVPGTKLYDIGGATAEGVKQLIKGADDFAKYLKESKAYKKFKPTVAAKMLKEELKRNFVDRSGNIRVKLLDTLGDIGYEIIQKMYLSKGASTISANMLKQMQKEVYRGLSGQEKEILDGLILSDRMADIAGYKPKFKFPEYISSDGKVPDKTITWRETFKQRYKLTDAEVANLQRRAEAYFEWMKKPLRDMLDAELISKEEYDALVSHNYRRIKLVDLVDRRYQAKVGKRKRTVYDSGVEALAKGRVTDIYERSSEIMALEVFNRAYGRIMNNEANRALLDLARKDPENPFVRIKEGKERIPSGWDRLFVYEKGERKAIYVSPELGKEWIINNPELSYRMSQVLRYASGSPVLRTFATGINWGFALANLPRDIMHTWFTARIFEDGKWKPVYSSHAPIFGLQIGRDLATVFLDSVLRKGRYQDYINEGGGMEFLVHQGRILQRGRHLEGPLDKVQNFLGYFGETSEVMTRLAIRERVLRKGKSNREATFAARDYMDFGQGGGVAKAMDNAVPYLNAAIQGTRGLFRAFKDNPIVSTYKLSQFAALTTGLYIAMKSRAPETEKNLRGSMDMTNNIVIPLGDEFGFLDNEGQMRYPYIKIPLDPGQRFFKKFFEASTDMWLGNEVDVDGTVDALNELTPVSISGLPPTLSGALGYISNKDFWLNKDIWKQSEPFSWPKSREEYTSETPQAFIDVGKATGLSPERLKYAVSELVTNGTLWSYLLGEGYEKAFGELPKEKKEQHLAMVLSQMPVAKRFIGVTNPYSKHAEKFRAAQEDVVLKEFVENRNFDILVEGYLYGEGVSRQDVMKEATKYKDKDTYDRLIDRFKFEESIKDLPEKSFWRRMKGLRLEAKAKVFADRLKSANEEERQQLWNEYGIVSKAGGVVSKEFREEVRRQFIK